MNYLLDTNTISSFLRENAVIKGRLKKAIKDGGRIFTSAINYYEAKRGLFAINAVQKLKGLEEFLKSIEIILLDDLAIFEEAIRIYAELKTKGSPISDNDVYIAACAKVKNLTLVSDDGDFGRVKRLQIENWLMR